MSRGVGVMMAFLSLVVAGGVWFVGQMQVDLPPIENQWSTAEIFAQVTSSGLDLICDEVMRTRPPDLVWTVATGEELRERPASVAFAELRRHIGRPVRVAGVLGDATTLYPSRVALAFRQWSEDSPRSRPLTLDLHLVWPGIDPATVTPWVADRCAAAEGTPELLPLAHSSSHVSLARVRRVEVWSEPHRPVESEVSPGSPSAQGTALRELRHELDALGPAAVWSTMARNRAQWRAFADGVRSGDPGWLVLAAAVRTSVAGEDAAELREALWWALSRNRSMILRFLSRQQLPIGELCGTESTGGADDDPEFDHLVWMIDVRLASLVNFEDVALGATARRCVAHLRAARKLLLSRAEASHTEWWKQARRSAELRR